MRVVTSIKYVGYRRNVHFSQRESIPLSRKRSLTGREYHPKICWYDSLYVILDLSWWLWTYRMREYFQIRDALHKLALFMVLQIPHFRKISTFPRCYGSLTQIEVYKNRLHTFHTLLLSIILLCHIAWNQVWRILCEFGVWWCLRIPFGENTIERTSCF